MMMMMMMMMMVIAIMAIHHGKHSNSVISKVAAEAFYAENLL
jgi:hypothetical protein